MAKLVPQEAFVPEKSGNDGSLRPRGTNRSKAKRDTLPFQSDPFAKCNSCGKHLAGCIIPVIEQPEKKTERAIILMCGHVLCMKCKSACKTAVVLEERVMTICSICQAPTGHVILPNSLDCNLSSCQAPYCTGESLTCTQARCGTCQRDMCENCIYIHAEKFPAHSITRRPNKFFNRKRVFTGCTKHMEPFMFKCECGDFLCPKCPYDFVMRLPGGEALEHGRSNIDELDLEFEDKLWDSLNLQMKVRSALRKARDKRDKLADLVDRTNNEICIMMNQIILQCIQRAWDVMDKVVKTSEQRYNKIDKLITTIEDIDRRITLGLEIDERARDYNNVYPDVVANLMRQTSHSLCKPALKKLIAAEKEQTILSPFEFEMDVLHTNTAKIMDEIRVWGSVVRTNVTKLETVEYSVRETEQMPVVSLTADMLYRIDLSEDIIGQHIPMRMHSALALFAELYERRFPNPVTPNEIGIQGPKKKPFQLGVRIHNETKVPDIELHERRAYETTMLSREGIYFMEPRIYGGIRKIHNLIKVGEDQTGLVLDAYRKTPVQPPIWGYRDRSHYNILKPIRANATIVGGRAPIKSTPVARNATALLNGFNVNGRTIQSKLISHIVKPNRIPPGITATPKSEEPLPLSATNKLIKEEEPDQQEQASGSSTTKVKEEIMDEEEVEAKATATMGTIEDPSPSAQSNPHGLRLVRSESARTMHRRPNNRMTLDKIVSASEEEIFKKQLEAKGFNLAQIEKAIAGRKAKRPKVQYRTPPGYRSSPVKHEPGSQYIQARTILRGKESNLWPRPVNPSPRLLDGSADRTEKQIGRTFQVKKVPFLADPDKPLPDPSRPRGRPRKDDVTAPSYRPEGKGECPLRSEDRDKSLKEDEDDVESGEEQKQIPLFSNEVMKQEDFDDYEELCSLTVEQRQQLYIRAQNRKRGPSAESVPIGSIPERVRVKSVSAAEAIEEDEPCSSQQALEMFARCLTEESNTDSVKRSRHSPRK